MAVADASVWINLAATRCAEQILGFYGEPFDITRTAWFELERGRAKGRQSADQIAALENAGLIRVVDLDPQDEELFLELVGGPGAQTLDDGEAATLVYAHRIETTAFIDERKATSLAAARFPSLAICTTLDLLLAPAVRSGLGDVRLGDALYGALIAAKMRVAPCHVEEVVKSIGHDRAKTCTSLPIKARSALDAGIP